jgi:hypothetical protein
VPAGEVVILCNLIKAQKLVDERKAEFCRVQTPRFKRSGNFAHWNTRGVRAQLAKDRTTQTADADVKTLQVLGLLISFVYQPPASDRITPQAIGTTL